MLIGCQFKLDNKASLVGIYVPNTALRFEIGLYNDILKRGNSLRR